MQLEKFKSSAHFNKIRGYVKAMEAMRVDPMYPVDVNMEQYIKAETKLSLDDFYMKLGVDPAFDTIENLMTSPELDIRWLVPELIREAVRLGFREAPIWPTITAYTETVRGLEHVLPTINISDATPKRVGEGETIGVGDVSYQSKRFGVHKFGRGIKITDEVRQYVALNLLGIYLGDFGLKMGYGVDYLAIDCLLNGEQADGSESAPVIGVATANTLVFRDIMKVWLRMAKIGRTPSAMLGGEDMALDLLDLPQFSTKKSGTTDYTLNVKTPMPQSADFYIHGAINDDQVIILDPKSGIIKLDAQPLKVESERIVSNQTEATYITFTTGFAKLFTDAAIVLDKSITFAANGFPPQMDVFADNTYDMDA